MTVSSSNRKAGPFLGNGVTTAFPFTFKVFKKEDVTVTYTDANGVDATLTLDSQYSVVLNADQDVSPGGAITYPTVASGLPTLPTGEKLTLTGGLAYTQPTSLPNLGPFFAQTVEDGFDRAEIQIQQVKEITDRAITISVSDTPLAPLPAAAARANEIIGFDALGNLTLYPLPASVGAGDMRVDTFTAGTDFTAGVTTQLILSRAPGNPANAEVFFDPLFQGPDQWSVAGNVLTFTGPIPVGVSKVFVRLGTTLSTQIPPAGSVTDTTVAAGTKLYNRINDLIDVKDPAFGAVGNGTADDRAAFVACDAAGRAYVIPEGTYRIASALVLSGKVTFMPGAVLKPDSNVSITFGQNFEAGTSYQIFDLSNANSFIGLPYNITEVWAEWWGASGQPPKVNNEIPFNQAVTALGVTATGGSGVAYGKVRFGRGAFFTSGPIALATQVSLDGSHSFYSLLKPNIPTWSGANMVIATNGTSPMFSSRISNCRLDANGIGSITAVIYSNAWQEKCGLFNVYVANFNGYGFQYQVGYGGAAHLRIQQCEFFPNNVNGAAGISISNTSSQGWLNLRLDEVTFGTPSSVPVGVAGAIIDNRILVSCSGVHFENVNSGFLLTGKATIGGSGIGGGLFVDQVFNCASSWTGAIDTTATHLGNATAMVTDSNRPYAIAANDPANGHMVWPPSPTRAIAAASITAGGSLLYSEGFSTSSNVSTGNYSCTLAINLDSSTSYDVVATVLGTGFQISVSPNTATQFNVTILNNVGAAVNAPFTVKVYHKG